MLVGKPIVTHAIVLSIRTVQESNGLVRFLTKEMGVVDATLFGGHKSHLRSLVSPWNSGILYLNEDKKKFLRVSDFDVQNYHISFREDISKMWMVSACAQIILKTQDIPSDKFWLTISGFVDGLDLCKTRYECTTGLLRFLWRYLALMGLQPDIARCASCQKSLLTSQSGAVYDRSEHSFLCKDCVGGDFAEFAVSAEGVRYLDAVNTLRPGDVRAIRLSDASIAQLRSILFYLIQEVVGSKIDALQSV